MNMVSSFFLRAKHWQMFLLLFGLMFLSQLAVFMSPTLLAARPLESMGKADLLPGVPMALSLVCFLIWLWSMGSFLSLIGPSSLKLGTRFFSFALIYPVIYIPLFILMAFRYAENPGMFALIIPFHLFAMFCMFYDLYFVSKSLALAEIGKQATFYDYAGPFFLIWFFPIGIWIIQPRVNRIYARSGAQSG